MSSFQTPEETLMYSSSTTTTTTTTTSSSSPCCTSSSSASFSVSMNTSSSTTSTCVPIVRVSSSSTSAASMIPVSQFLRFSNEERGELDTQDFSLTMSLPMRSSSSLSNSSLIPDRRGDSMSQDDLHFEMGQHVHPNIELYHFLDEQGSGPCSNSPPVERDPWIVSSSIATQTEEVRTNAFSCLSASELANEDEDKNRALGSQPVVPAIIEQVIGGNVHQRLYHEQGVQKEQSASAVRAEDALAELLTEARRFSPMEAGLVSLKNFASSDQGSGLLNTQSPPQVLIIYTGGTLGMTQRDDGAFAPDPSFLEDTLRNLPEIKDSTMPNVDFVSLREPFDSSDASFDEWEEIASCVAEHYEHYDGFVIAHGTDTLAFTASALSFMLMNLRKPIVMTGSMIPLCVVRSDARANLLDSILIAGFTRIPEVLVCFDRKILRGNRTRKLDAILVPAFQSPNYFELGHAGVHITVAPNRVLPFSSEPFAFFPRCSRDVVLLKIYPGVGRRISEMLQPPTKGVVLEAYGSGNAPHNIPEFSKALRSAVEKGVIVVVVSNCNHSRVDLEQYAAGKFLLDLGCVSGKDMTPEAAFTKLSALLAREHLSRNEIIRLMQSDLCGELCEDTNTSRLLVL